MKKVLVLLLGFTCITTFALPIVYEPFNYSLTPTNLIGHANTDGFSWALCGPNTNGVPQPFISSGSFTNGGLPGVGNSAQFGNIDFSSNSVAARLSLKSSLSSGTVYYSVLLRLTDTNKMTTASGGTHLVCLNNSAGAQVGVPTVIGAAIRVRLDASGLGFNFGTAKASTTASDMVWDTAVHDQGETNFIVGSYTFNTVSGSDDVSSLWINPDSSTFATSTPPSPTLTTSSGSDISSAVINSLVIFNRGGIKVTAPADPPVPRSYVVDQVLIGTTWADVTLTNVPIAVTTQPKNARAIAGGIASFSVATFNATTFQWQHNNLDIPGATQTTLNLTGLQASDAGSYHIHVSNGPASTNSNDALLSVVPDTFPRFIPLWSLAPFSRPYLSTDSSTQPNQRCIAYSAQSNQVLIITRTNNTAGYLTNQVFVLNADNGADLYQMNADPTIITGGLDIGGGTNIMALNCIDVADDGAVYAANVSTNDPSVPNNGFKVYRWDNSGANAAPVLIWNASDPNSPGANGPRWGNALAVRGSGTGTQMLLADQNGLKGSVLSPNPGHPVTDPWTYGPFTDVFGGVVGGRTLLYFGNTNTFWEKHGSGNLNLITYDNTATFNSSIVTNYPNPSGSPGLLAFNAATNVLAGINFASSSSVPDTMDQIDLSDPSQPLYIASYNFPTNHQANNNGNGRVIFAGDRVYALDSNNGLAAWTLVPVLHITSDAPNVVLSWSSEVTGYTLKATPSLITPTTWTNVGTGTVFGNQYFVTNSAGAAALFYRLQK